MKKISNILLIIMLTTVFITEVGDMVATLKKVEKFIVENQDDVSNEDSSDNE